MVSTETVALGLGALSVIATATSALGGQWIIARNTRDTQQQNIEVKRKEREEALHMDTISALSSLAAELKLNAQIASRGGTFIEDGNGERIMEVTASLNTEAYIRAQPYLHSVPPSVVDDISEAYADITLYLNAGKYREALPDNQRINSRISHIMFMTDDPCLKAYRVLTSHLNEEIHRFNKAK